MTKVLIIPGSTRDGSVNVKLAHTIAKSVGESGADATVISLSDYPMPIFNEDLEADSGSPEQAKELAALMVEHNAIVLVNPEYNASLTPLMKNTLDWLSRDVGVKPYQGRVFGLASCSPGGLGGIRGLSHVRDVLVNVGAEMITPQLAVGSAGSAFTGEDTLSDERTAGMLQNMVQTLIERAKQIS